MPEITFEYLMEYISEIRTNQPGPLLVRFNSEDEPLLDKLNFETEGFLKAPAVNYILKQRNLSAKTTKAFKPHDLRGTYATNQIDAGTDIFVVSNLLGHANIATTQVYDLREDDAAIKAAREFKVC